MDEDSELFLHLPVGYALKNGATVYSILSVLGDGGFGVTYLAQDEKLQRRVAIKEYYPRDFAGRTTTSTIVPASRAQVDLFNWGKARFLDEARTLARFDHPGIVGVLDFFEANNTAYLVMQYVDGLPISTLLKTQSLDENGARTLLTQLISALKIVHGAGYLHRDVKPANIMIHRESGQPVLIDFGAARQSLGSQTHSVTAMASASFSPKEQYLENAPQTAASEVYSICATIYRAMFQAGPPVSISRDEDETLIELDAAEAAGHVTPAFASLLRKGLAYHQRNRFQSLEDLQQAMTDAPVVDPVGAKPKKKPAAKKTTAAASIEAPAPSKRIKTPTVRPKIETRPPKSWLRPQWIGLAAVAVLGLLVALLWPVFGPTTAPQTVTAIEPAAPIEQPLPSPCQNGQGQACFTALRDNPAYEFLPNDVQRRGYEMACELGTAPACQLVAAWHRTGIGGPINLMTSLDYYDEACRLKEPNGCIERALILNDPDSGVKQDKPAAIAALKRACDDLSSPRACNILMFDRFQSASPSKAAAPPKPAQTSGKPYSFADRQACLNRDGFACQRIGFAYEQGLIEGYGAADNAAVVWYAMSCNLNTKLGCANLGRFFEYGKGGKTVSKSEAKKLYTKACTLGHKDACDWAKQIGD